jgi:hypothetical protein
MMADENKLAIYAAISALACIAGGHAAAEVVGVAANGFEIRESAHVAAAPDKVYWWSSDHTFSGSAANLVLDARAGGCWCETLPGGGSAEHLRVVYVAPGKMLRLRGALGPFQALGVDGALTLSVKGAAEGSDISFTYTLGGFAKDGFDELSKAADHVLGAQLERLKNLVDEPATHAH